MDYLVRSLTESDISQVIVLDKLSGNQLKYFLDVAGYCWGLFLNQELAGYCSIGYADDVDSEIEDYEGYSCDSLLLSDVFIKEEYRHQGYALLLVDKAIKECMKEVSELIFLTLLDSKLSHLYEKIGFQCIDDYTMVRDERKPLNANG